MLPQQDIESMWFTGHDRATKFWKKVALGAPDDCWDWIGAKRADGYGLIVVKKLQLKAHRVSFVMHKGRNIKPDMVIDHTCRNKACVNPAHLDEITQAQNVARYHAGLGKLANCGKSGHKPRKRGHPCGACTKETAIRWKAANPDGMKEIQKRYETRRAERRRLELAEWRSKCIEVDPDLIS